MLKQKNVGKFGEEINVITNRNVTNMGLEEFLLQRAEKRGMEKGKAIGIKMGIEIAKKNAIEQDIIYVKGLFAHSDFSDERIAALVGVSLEFVQKVKAMKE